MPELTEELPLILFVTCAAKYRSSEEHLISNIHPNLIFQVTPEIFSYRIRRSFKV